MTSIAETLETVRRFDRPGPRYTSYPSAVEFHEGVDDQAYLKALAHADGQKEAPLSLYLHLPFCEHRCLFCGCNVVITRHRKVAGRYLDYLKQEVELVARHLTQRREVVQMHWGGGTPTYYTPQELRDLYVYLQRYFTIQPDAELAIEVDPRVTTRAHLDTLRELGFNRISLGVQDLTPEVQEAITRNQTYEQTRDLMTYAREVGFEEGINVDLIYGLPRQTLETFHTNLDQVLDLRPDRVALYSFAYVPWIKGHQRQLDASLLPPPERKLELFLSATERFLEAGYEPIGMDHFALPSDDLARAAREHRLHRNFMGYTVMPASDVVAFGVSGIGEVQGGFYQNEKKLSTYYAALDEGRLPLHRGYLLNEDDRIRQFVIAQLMCNFQVEKAEVHRRFGIAFDDYFASSLADLDELEQAGCVHVGEGKISVTPQGRLVVRNVCMAFDHYQAKKRQDKRVFSRTI